MIRRHFEGERQAELLAASKASPRSLSMGRREGSRSIYDYGIVLLRHNHSEAQETEQDVDAFAEETLAEEAVRLQQEYQQRGHKQQRRQQQRRQQQRLSAAVWAAARRTVHSLTHELARLARRAA